MRGFKSWLLLALVWACGVHAKTLTFCTEGNPEALTPALGSNSTTFNVTSQFYEGLISFQPGSTDLMPALATSWTVSSDGLEYVFNLRKGVKWHSNKLFSPSRDFNADDVLFTFERQWKSNHPYFKVSTGRYPYFNSMMVDDLASIQKIDNYKVKFVLKNRTAPFVSNLAMRWAGIQSAEYAQKLLDKGTPAVLDELPIGTGPFQFESYNKDQSIRFRAFEAYWSGRPKLDELVFAITPDPAQRWQKLKSNECQMLIHPNPADLPTMRDDPRMTVLSQTGLNVAYVAYNVKKKPFDDVRVRQALNMAIDKRRLLRAAYQYTAIPATNPIPPVLWSHNRNVEDDIYSPALAKELLAQAGYPNGFTAELWAMPVQRPYMAKPMEVARLLKENWAEIGVDIKIETPDWQRYGKDMQMGKHEMALYGWTGDNGDPDNFLNTLLGCDSVGGNNVSQFCDANYDSLVKRAKTLQNQQERAKLYEQAQVIFKQQAPWYTIAHVSQHKVMRREVVGFELSPLGWHDFRRVDLLPSQ